MSLAYDPILLLTHIGVSTENDIRVGVLKDEWSIPPISLELCGGKLFLYR